MSLVCIYKIPMELSSIFHLTTGVLLRLCYLLIDAGPRSSAEVMGQGLIGNCSSSGLEFKWRALYDFYGVS